MSTKNLSGKQVALFLTVGVGCVGVIAAVHSVGSEATPTLALGLHAIAGPSWACATAIELDTARRYLQEGDKAAADKYLSGEVDLGECRTFDDGDKVYVVEAVANGARFHKQGDTREYWAFANSFRVAP